MDEDALIERLKQQISTGRSPSEEYHWVRQHANPPVTMADFIEAEAKLGFALPPLLKHIYCEVGNGGFGPGYRLFKLTLDPSVDDEYDYALVDTYLAFHPPDDEGYSLSLGEESDEAQQPIYYYEYPPQVLMICGWGCSISSFIDCSSSEYRVLRKDHNYSLTEHVLESPSFHQWLEGWLDGVPLFYSWFGKTKGTWNLATEDWEQSSRREWEEWKQTPKVLFSPSST